MFMDTDPNMPNHIKFDYVFLIVFNFNLLMKYKKMEKMNENLNKNKLS